jgi:hypothetical protein
MPLRLPAPHQAARSGSYGEIGWVILSFQRDEPLIVLPESFSHPERATFPDNHSGSSSRRKITGIRSCTAFTGARAAVVIIENALIPSLLIPIRLPKPGKSKQTAILPVETKRDLPAASHLLPFIKPIRKHQAPAIQKIIPKRLLFLQSLGPYINQPKSAEPWPNQTPPHGKNRARRLIQNHRQILGRRSIKPRRKPRADKPRAKALLDSFQLTRNRKSPTHIIQSTNPTELINDGHPHVPRRSFLSLAHIPSPTPNTRMLRSPESWNPNP